MLNFAPVSARTCPGLLLRLFSVTQFRLHTFKKAKTDKKTHIFASGKKILNKLQTCCNEPDAKSG